MTQQHNFLWECHEYNNNASSDKLTSEFLMSLSVFLWNSKIKETGGLPSHMNMFQKSSQNGLTSCSRYARNVMEALEGLTSFLAHLFYCVWPEYDLYPAIQGSTLKLYFFVIFLYKRQTIPVDYI